MHSANHRCVRAAIELSGSDDSNDGFARTTLAETAPTSGFSTDGGNGPGDRYRGASHPRATGDGPRR